MTVLAVCNGTFNAAAFDGNPFLLFWGGGESSGWPTKRGEGKRPILRMASQSSLFCSDSSTARRHRGARCRRFVLCTVVGLPRLICSSLNLQLTIVCSREEKISAPETNVGKKAQKAPSSEVAAPLLHRAQWCDQSKELRQFNIYNTNSNFNLEF